MFVEKILHVLSHLFAPGARLHRRKRLPEFRETLDGLSLMDELARVLLDVLCALLLGLVFRQRRRAQSFFLLSANRFSGGVRDIEMEKSDPDLAFARPANFPIQP